MKTKMPVNEQLYVKSLSGATVNGMKDFVRPIMRWNTDLIVLHVGTNDLKSEKKPR